MEFILIFAIGMAIMVVSIIARGIRSEKLTNAQPIFKAENVTIISLSAEHKNEWLNLWERYLDFYESELALEQSLNTFSRLIDPDHETMIGRVAINHDGAVIGFSNSVLHPYTWGENSVCYLEDLFVHPSYRKQGVGQALIDDLVSMAKEKKWDRLYWHTAQDNETARKIYDKYTKADKFVKYQLSIR